MAWSAIFDWDGVIIDSSKHHEESWERLAREISYYLGTLPNRFAGGVEGCSVHYNKAGRVRANLTNTASIRLSYSQKPVSFNQEREFRFVVISGETPSTWFDGDYLPIDLGRALTYVTVI